MSVLSSISGALFGNDGADAAQNASDAQVKAANEAIAEQQRQFDLTRSDFAPYRDTGVNALGQLVAQNAQLQANPNALLGDFTASPDYQFRLDQGEKAVQRSAAARGMLGSGATVKALSDYGQNTASGEYANWYNRTYGRVNDSLNRLAAVAGIGQTATASTAQAGQNSTNAISQLQQDIGTAQASSYIGAYNAQQQNIGNLLSLVGSGARVAAGGFGR